MHICKICGQEVVDGDVIDDLSMIADYFGMECLTEKSQSVLNRTICEECFFSM